MCKARAMNYTRWLIWSRYFSFMSSNWDLLRFAQIILAKLTNWKPNYQVVVRCRLGVWKKYIIKKIGREVITKFKSPSNHPHWHKKIELEIELNI